MRYRYSIYFFIILAALTFLFDSQSVLAVGGWNMLCSEDVCYTPPRRRPNPDIENRQYAKQALHKVFASEEKQFSGLRGFIDSVNNLPYKRAFDDIRTLRKHNDKANADALANWIKLNRSVYLSQTGIQQWIDRYLPPEVTDFSPENGIVGDIIKIRGKHLDKATEVRFLKGRGVPKIISSTEISVAVPDYIGGVMFSLEVISPYGQVTSTKQFRQLLGDCSDKRISRAIAELWQRGARGDEASGECDPSHYNSAKYQNYEQLLTYMREKYGNKKREAPRITSVFPYVGPPGTKVRIEGNNLYQLKKIYFGDKEAHFTSESEYLALASVPEEGSGILRLDTYSGFTYYQPSNSPYPFSFTAVSSPTLTGFDPHDLLVGDTLRILGGNFGSDPTVHLPGLAGFYVTVKTPTEIHVRMTDPGKNIGVRVATSGGEVTSGGSFTVWTGECSDPWIIQGFLDLWERRPYGQGDDGQCDPAQYRDGHWTSYEDLKFGIRQRYGYKEKDAPTISRIEPATGVAGQWVTIFGAGFDEVRSVIFGNNTAEQIERRSSGELRAKIGFGTGSGDVYISTLYGVKKFSGFIIGYPPTISSVTPGEALPGSDVFIRGERFAEVSNVSFANTSAAMKSKTDNEIVAVVPKGLSGKMRIMVNSPKGSASWESFGIVEVKVSSPTGKLRDIRLEFFSSDGTFLGGAPLIGNAGAGLTDEQINTLIGNAGAGIIGNTAGGLANVTPLSIQDISTLIGNTAGGLANVTPLLGNTAGGLSEVELARIIGNTAGGIIGNTAGGLTQVIPLVGNTGAGLVEVSLSVWSGISLSDLIANTGGALVGNTGAGIVLPPEDTLTQVTPVTIGTNYNQLTSITGGHLTSTTGAGLTSRGVMSLIGKRSVQLPVTPPVVSKPKEIPKVKPIPVKVPVPSPASTSMPVPVPTPVLTPVAPVAPPPPEPTRPTCATGSMYSVTFGRCIEDAPVLGEEKRPTCPEGESYSITLKQCVR